MTDARRHLIGVLLLLLAAVGWSLSGGLIKRIHDPVTGPHGVTIAFYRSLIAGLVLLPMAWGRFGTLRTIDPVRSIIPIRPAGLSCVLFFALMTACFVVANTLTEAANVIMLQYTSTFWVFGLSPWILREKPGGKDLGILGLAVLGIGIIIVGGRGGSMAGIALALAAGLFFGLLTLMIRRMRECNSAAVTVMNNLGSALLMLPFVLWLDDLTVPGRAWLWLLVLGVVQFGIPYYLYTLGLARVPAYEAALITMLEPVLVPVWAYLSVGEEPPPPALLGGGVILLALILLVQKARRASRVT